MRTNNELADEFLFRFKDSKTIIVEPYCNEDRIGWNVNMERKLITHNAGYSQEFTITPHGIKVLKEGEWEKYIDSVVEADKLKSYREEVTFKKLRTDFNLVEEKVKDYGTTKLFSRVSFWIAISLGVLKIIEILK
jgi:hypothetical protein